jgi:IS30 family transposase
MLARAASTVSREINRNGGVGRYRVAAADKLAWKQARRPKPCKLAIHGQLRQTVVRKLELNWSPEQIAGWLKRAYPETEAWCMSQAVQHGKQISTSASATPQSPLQRGSSENTNRLLRQYFPKGLDLAAHSKAELNKVARQLNERPRKTLDFQSPAVISRLPPNDSV